MADTGEKDTETTASGTDGHSKEALAVISMLHECGIQEFDPRVVSMLMDVRKYKIEL